MLEKYRHFDLLYKGTAIITVFDAKHRIIVPQTSWGDSNLGAQDGYRNSVKHEKKAD